MTTKVNTSEIIKDPYFIEFVKDGISELRKNRNERPEPKQGFRYKRDWYDRMTQYSIFNTDYFIQNIESIWLKKSSLSSEIRHVIQYVCDKALDKTIELYSRQAVHEVSQIENKKI